MLKHWIVAVGLMLVMTRNTYAGEESLYDFLWLDPDKSVYVLQNKLYKKEHKMYADIGYLTNMTSKFQDTSGFAVKAGYYIHEEWGLEIFYHNYSNGNNDDYRNVKSVNGVIPFVRRLNSTMGAAIIYSPFYGKINTFNKIFYFDWSFGAGLSRVQAESNVKTVRILNAANKYETENYGGALLKTKLKFHLTENMHLGIEYMNTYYMAPGPVNPKSDKLRTNSDLIFSVGISY
jgi:outer membrane beta-barrel protein